MTDFARDEVWWSYVCCGVGVLSNRRLSALKEYAAEFPPKITIRRHAKKWIRDVLSAGPPRHWIKQLEPERVVLAIEDFGAISITPGSIDWAVRSEQDCREIQGYLLGVAFGVALYQLGMLPFHVSACSINGRAIAFAGLSGAGKSTMAYALSTRFGGSVVCDDISRCLVDAGGVTILPGLSGVRLLRDSIDTLHVGSLRPVRDERHQKKYRVPTRGCSVGTSLDALVWIETDRDPDGFQLTRVSAGERLQRWWESLYAPDFGRHLTRWSNVRAQVLEIVQLVPTFVMRKGSNLLEFEDQGARLLKLIGEEPQRVLETSTGS